MLSFANPPRQKKRPLPREQQAKLFQPFTQADESTTRQFGGTGMGLALTRHIAHMLGGEISLRSALGQGTTFAVRVRV